MSKSATNPNDTFYREQTSSLRTNDQQQPTRWNREHFSTKCNLPGAEDIEASNNRMIALNWLYRLSGRTNGIYTGLWAQYQAKLEAAKAAL